MFNDLDRDQRFEIVKTIHRIEGLIDKLPDAIAAAVAAAVVEHIREDAANE